MKKIHFLVILTKTDRSESAKQSQIKRISRDLDLVFSDKVVTQVRNRKVLCVFGSRVLMVEFEAAGH